MNMLNKKIVVAAGVPFQALGPTVGAYVAAGGKVYFSIDGVNFGEYEEALDPDTNVFINGVVSGMYIKFENNAIVRL